MPLQTGGIQIGFGIKRLLGLATTGANDRVAPTENLTDGSYLIRDPKRVSLIELFTDCF
jgi:hypothetical protein